MPLSSYIHKTDIRKTLYNYDKQMTNVFFSFNLQHLLIFSFTASGIDSIDFARLVYYCQYFHQ